MMRAPGFWQGSGTGSCPCCSRPRPPSTPPPPRGACGEPGWRAPVPVICCGNATAGGAGKTTVALDIGRRLANRGIAVHFLLRGYGGSLRGPARVDTAAHDSTVVGDEALLLAAERPTWIAADRAAGARAALAAGRAGHRHG